MSDVPTFVSTGQLPPGERVTALVVEAYDRFRGNSEGELSTVYPSLAAVDPERFGICVAGVGGATVSAGDAETEFTIMSVAKPFTFALMGGVHGPQAVLDFVGVNATGRRFNAVSAIEDRPDGRTNPMVNPGAIATASMSLPPETGPRWSWWVPPVIATVCGAALPFVPRSAPWLRAAFVLVAGAQLFLWGWARRSGLTKPVLPTSAPFSLDRLVSAAGLTAGIGLVILAVVDLAQEIRARSPQPQPAA